MSPEELYEYFIANPIEGVEPELDSSTHLNLFVGPHYATICQDRHGHIVFSVNNKTFISIGFDHTNARETLRSALLEAMSLRPESPFLEHRVAPLTGPSFYADVLREHFTQCRDKLNTLLSEQTP